MSAEGSPHYRSFGAQTRHYFHRAQQSVPLKPLAGPSVWKGVDLRADPQSWFVLLSSLHAAEIRTAARRLLDTGVALEAVDADSFTLPTAAAEIRNWRRRITEGVGFVVVRGLAIDDWSEEEAEMAFWGIGHHLGVPGAQNPDQELLGHVRDYREVIDNPSVRLYRTSANIDFHCDAADVVGLFCLAEAKSGGQSRIVSTGWLYNELLREDPELAGVLFEPFKLDGRGEQRPGAGPFSELPPCAYADGVLKTFYHSEYMRSVVRHPGVTLTSDQLRILDLYDEWGRDPDVCLEMWLKPGDMQFLSNHTIAHARTAFEDDPLNPRHLLRLWLSLD